MDSQNNSPQPSESQPAHILVVDDEVFIRDSIRIYLESHGYRVSIAENAAAARQVAAGTEIPIDVAILDLVMPGGNGIELLRELKKIDPDIEAIIATGCGSMNSAIEALRHGAFDYITKPIVDFDEDLLKSVRAAVEARRGKRAVPARRAELPELEEPPPAGGAPPGGLLEALGAFALEHAGKPLDGCVRHACADLLRRAFGAEEAVLGVSQQGGFAELEVLLPRCALQDGGEETSRTRTTLDVDIPLYQPKPAAERLVLRVRVPGPKRGESYRGALALLAALLGLALGSEAGGSDRAALADATAAD